MPVVPFEVWFSRSRTPMLLRVRDQLALPPQGQLFFGDNLEVLRRHIVSESVDLVYLDPPFKSDKNYNILFEHKDGRLPAAQVKAFDDTWRWDMGSAAAYQEIVEGGGEVSKALIAFRQFLGTSDMLAYLTMMAPRLIELRRVLRPTGSIYLHCDTAASHYLKILMDSIFGPRNFRNEIIWRRTGSNSALKRFGPLHQTIFYYVKTSAAPFYPVPGPYTVGYVKEYFTEHDERGRYRPVLLTGPGTRQGDSGKPWRLYDPTTSGRHWQPSSYVYWKYRQITGEDLAQYPLLERLEKFDEVGLIHWAKKRGGGVPNYRYYLADAPGVYFQDMWAYQPGTEGSVYGRPNEGIDQDVKWLSTKDRERLGYPTQKPEGVLSRIIRSSSKEGDLVLDPFCGCGTTVAVAQSLGRRWIGIDITTLAINIIQDRLRKKHGAVDYTLRGEPSTIDEAKALAELDKHEFQRWACERLGITGGVPRGADRGIDGEIVGLYDDGEPWRALVSVKGGKLKVEHVRDLVGTMTRERAEIGVLVTLKPPTRPMKREAADAGFTDEGLPKVQILQVSDLLAGKRPDLPERKREAQIISRSRKAI